jgi:hypothetical protein
MLYTSLGASVVLTILAFVCGRHTQDIQGKYRREAEVLSPQATVRLRATEERWRRYTHAATLLCLVPLPLSLLPFTELTAFFSRTATAAVVCTATLAFLKWFTEIEIGKLLSSDIGLANQLALAAIGLGAGTAVGATFSLLSDAVLREAFLEALSK